MVRTPCSQCNGHRGHGSIPGWGRKIQPAMWLSQKSKSKKTNKKTEWNQLRSGVRQGRGQPVARGSSPLPASLPSHLCFSTCGKVLPPMVTHVENQSPYSLSVAPILPSPSALPCLQTQIPPEASISSLAFWQLSQPTGSSLGRKEQTHMHGQGL